MCGYIGGDALNVWSAADWESQPARYRLPIFVRANPPGPGAAADAAAALKALRGLGAPEGTLVAWDMETAVDASYIRQVESLISEGGYKLIVYGSQSSVRGNDNPTGLYWGADWTGHPHIAAGDAMTQWVSYSNYDLSEAQEDLPFWDTKATPSLLTLMLHDQEGPNMLLLPKGTPTPIAIPDGATSIRFTTVFGAAGSFPSAELSVNWHGITSGPVTVTVNPHESWPVLAIPSGVQGACVYRVDGGSHYVSATVYGPAGTANTAAVPAAATASTPAAAAVPAAGPNVATAAKTSATNGAKRDSFLHQPPTEWANVAKRLLNRRKS